MCRFLAVALMMQLTAAAAQDPVLQSRGYSWIVDRTVGGFKLYQEVGGACWPDPDGESLQPALALELRGDGQLVRLSEDRDQATIYSFAPILQLPAGCAHPDTSDRAAVVAIAALMATRYPGFEARHMDFGARRKAIFDLLPDQPTPAQAFAAAEGLLAGLADAHLELSAEIDGVEHALEVSEGLTLDAIHARKSNRSERDWLKTWRSGVQQTILGGHGHVAANDRIFWGVQDGIGYLTIVTMGRFDPDDDSATAPLDEALDQAVAAFAYTRAVIVDVSNNRGGYDAVSLHIAGRFADRTHVAYQKRGWGSDVAYQSLEVRPSNRARYLGPVWLLTSDITVSAGETFTQAMSVLPNVIHAGTETRGAFSDQTSIPLANGWQFAMPMEAYLDPEGRSLEGHGLRPQERIELYPPDNLDQGHARAVLRLMARLRHSLKSDQRTRPIQLPSGSGR